MTASLPRPLCSTSSILKGLICYRDEQCSEICFVVCVFAMCMYVRTLCACVHACVCVCVCMPCVHAVCTCCVYMLCVHVCLYDDWLLFSSFKQLVEDTPPSDLLSAEEKEELWSTVAAESGVPEVPQVRDTNSRDSGPCRICSHIVTAPYLWTHTDTPTHTCIMLLKMCTIEGNKPCLHTTHPRSPGRCGGDGCEE